MRDLAILVLIAYFAVPQVQCGFQAVASTWSKAATPLDFTIVLVERALGDRARAARR